MGECWAGRKAFNKGSILWQNPCTRSMNPTHVIVAPDFPGSPQIELCDFHYHDVLAQGLVTNPNPTESEIDQWERRIGRRP